ncbi:DDE-type integrase/transposase/recombinase [uncultured Succinivibrio sp.]|uniref:DDE-type integrase/transposase/recombinase n=1 Tax=uncultured Succinivibrio sp. TaxID=540749 RepID=UPI0025D0A1F2|nr:DDE-type integrase/transposase/recombinase [uncultured Succinivibrio sp.]
MSKNKYAANDKFQSTADYRLQVIAPLLHIKAETKIEKTEFFNKLKAISSDSGVSKRTIKRWLADYTEKGIAGLNTKYPKIRTDKKLYIKFESLLDEAKAMRLQSPTISVNEIIACLEGRHPDLAGIIKRSTLQDHLSKNGYGRNELLRKAEVSGRAFFGRYRKLHKMSQIQGDVKEPPRHCVVNEKGFPVTPYIQLWMDNFSRKILTYKIDISQREELALSSFKLLIELYGIPETILTDQGSIYHGQAFNHCCHCLGITHKRSKPYTPQSKGALERANGTLDALLDQIRLMNDLRYDKFVELIAQWIEEYNNRPHSALLYTDEQGKKHKLSPNEAFNNDRTMVRIADLELLTYAFTTRSSRRVSKDGTISFKGKLYKINAGYAKAGERVTIVYSSVDAKIELAVKKAPQDIGADGNEYEFVPLFEHVITADVDFTDRTAKKETDLHQEQSFEGESVVTPVVERYYRDIAKKNGTYKDESSFKEQLSRELLFKKKESEAPAQQSLYKLCQKGD